MNCESETNFRTKDYVGEKTTINQYEKHRGTAKTESNMYLHLIGYKSVLVGSSEALWSLACFCCASDLLETLSSNHFKMSENTRSRFSGSSPYERECHMSGYNWKVLSTEEADSYNNLLTDGSVTLSFPPWRTRNGNDTYYFQQLVS